MTLIVRFHCTDILGSYIICIFCVITLLKVVSSYDLSVLFMAVVGFPKKNWIRGGWWCEPYLFFFNFAMPLLNQVSRNKQKVSLAIMTTWVLAVISRSPANKEKFLKCLCRYLDRINVKRERLTTSKQLIKKTTIPKTITFRFASQFNPRLITIQVMNVE